MKSYPKLSALRRLTLCLVIGLLATVYGAVAADPKPVPPVDMAHWKSVPCVKGRLAADADTKANRAVFVLSSDPGALRAVPMELSLPHPAVWHDAERYEEVPVIVIQAEQMGEKKVVGFRIVKGGLGAALFSELTLLDAPDARFKP